MRIMLTDIVQVAKKRAAKGETKQSQSRVSSVVACDASECYTFMGFTSVDALGKRICHVVLDSVEETQGRGKKEPLGQVSLRECREQVTHGRYNDFHCKQ